MNGAASCRTARFPFEVQSYVYGLHVGRHEPQVAAPRNILLYLDSQWRRLREWHSGPCDVLAFAIRSLIELYFWTNRILESVELAQQFLNESDVEEEELLKEHLKIELEHDHMSLPRSVLKVLSSEWTGSRTRFKKTDKYEPLLYKERYQYIDASPWVINNLCRMHDRTCADSSSPMPSTIWLRLTN